MHILTHRGLNPSKKEYYKESSLEAFMDQLMSGFGLEFDLQFTKDMQIVISHDHTLKTISSSLDTRAFTEMSKNVILSLEFDGCHIASLEQLLLLIKEKQSHNSISAIHIKYTNQDKEKLDILLTLLEQIDEASYILFDLTVASARYIKQKNPIIKLACSVSHPYDIERFGDFVGGTLLTQEEAIQHNSLFSWVWLDEWDRRDRNGGEKKLYTQEAFDLFRKNNLKIALVTPDLHSTSPSLLGGESHEDANTIETLEKRIQEIITLQPDALCTDYPDYVKKLF